MSDERKWLTVAIERGAKITKRTTEPRLWVVLDQKDTWLWDAYFNTAEAAARAYCHYHGYKWPDTAASLDVQVQADEMRAVDECNKRGWYQGVLSGGTIWEYGYTEQRFRGSAVELLRKLTAPK